MIFVDSNVWIFASIKNLPEYKRANLIIKRMIDEEKELAINSIIVSEVFHKIYKLTGHSNAKNITSKILNSSYVVFLPFNLDTVIKAVKLSESYNIRINDALIAQHTIDTDSEGILTDNVKDFKKVPRITIIPLR